MPKFTRGQVISLQWPPNTSFSWTNGLYVVIEVKDKTELNLCKLTKEGKLERYGDNRMSISCTGTGNEYIEITHLTYLLGAFE